MLAIDRRVHGANNYHRMEEVGRGGFSVIHSVRSVKDNKVYVEKVLQKTNPKSTEELRMLSRMQNCKGVVKLHDIYEDADNTYVIMEKGWKDISATHAISYNICNEDDAKKIVAQALKILAQGHAQGIVHLDVKGGNFMWRDEKQRELMAIDWGLSLELPKDQMYVDQKDFSGTPWFMAPEQLRSEATDKSDVWAVGVLAHQLLTGTMPFNDKANPVRPSVSAIWRSILMDEVDFTRGVWKNVSAEGRDFVRTVLNKDPSVRPSAVAVLQHPWLWNVIKEFDVQECRKQRFAWYGKILSTCMTKVASACKKRGVDLSSTPEESLRKNPLIVQATHDLFMSLDKDGDGVLSIEDLAVMLNDTMCLPWEEKAELERVRYMMGDTMDIDAFQKWILGEPTIPTYMF